jgi:hypothetical protein
MHVNVREEEKVKERRKGDIISSEPALIWKLWMVFVVLLHSTVSTLEIEHGG